MSVPAAAYLPENSARITTKAMVSVMPVSRSMAENRFAISPVVRRTTFKRLILSKIERDVVIYREIRVYYTWKGESR
jgi:hypothetical protein